MYVPMLFLRNAETTTAQAWFPNNDLIFRRKAPVAGVHSGLTQTVSLPGISCCTATSCLRLPPGSAGDTVGWVKPRTYNGLSKPGTCKAQFLIS